MKRVFISYSRLDRDAVMPLYELVRDQVTQDVFLDKQIQGGQDWWNQILGAIAYCDVFIATISPNTLHSTACKYERDYARNMRRTVVPVSVAHVNVQTLPPDLARSQILPYPADALSAMSLYKALICAADPPPPPQGVAPPPAPLSYLSDLAGQVSQPQLDGSQQMRMIELLGPALHAADPEERNGATDLLRELSGRRDLTAATRYGLQGLGFAVGSSVQVTAPPRGPAPSPPSPTPTMAPLAPRTGATATAVLPSQKKPMNTGCAILVGVALAFVLLFVLLSL